VDLVLLEVEAEVESMLVVVVEEFVVVLVVVVG
jgi:hypothetical protein